MRGDILVGADEQFCAVRGDKSICFSRLQIKTVTRHWILFWPDICDQNEV